MRVLGIDPSTHCGFAVVDSGKKVIFTEEATFKDLTGFERCGRLAGRMMEIIEEYKPDLIVFEDMFVGHASSAVTIIQIGSILRYFLWQEEIEYINVGATALKKFVAGGGTAKKEQMMMFVQKNWGFTSKTNNIADAVGLAMFGLALKGEAFSAPAMAVCRAFLIPKPAKPRKSSKNNCT